MAGTRNRQVVVTASRKLKRPVAKVRTFFLHFCLPGGRFHLVLTFEAQTETGGAFTDSH